MVRAFFNISYGNHGNTPTHIDDIVSYLKLYLEEAGHYVQISQHLQVGFCNIILEYFDEQLSHEVVKYMEKGVMVVVVVTEFVTGQAFNHFDLGNVDKSWYSLDNTTWKDRFGWFRRVADKAHSVWCIIDGQVEGYKEIVAPEKVHLLPIGHVDGFSTVSQRVDRDKNIDFLFTGEVTSRRKAILGQLRDRGYAVETLSSLTPTYIRKDLVSRAKVCLNMKQFDQWKYPSQVRCYYHLMNSSFIISEKYESSSQIDDYIEVYEPESFVQACIDAIHTGDYSSKAVENLERFREEMPIKPQMIRFLEEAFGG